MPIPETRLTATSDIRRVTQGEELTITVELFDEVSGQVLDLDGATAATATFVGTPLPDAPTLPVPVTATLDDGEITILQDGRLAVRLTSEKTALLMVGDRWWQIMVELANGDVRIAQVCDQFDVVRPIF